MGRGSATFRHGAAGLALTAFMAAVVVLAPASLALGGTAPAIHVTVDRTSISRNEQLNIEIVINGSYDDVKGPSLDGFEVLGRSEGRSFSFGMGGSTSERTISLTVAPSKTGRLTVGAARLVTDGKVVASSRPIDIEVADSDAPEPAQRPGRRSGIRSLFPQVQMPQIEAVKSPVVEVRLFPKPADGAGAPVVFPGQPMYLEYALLTPTLPDYWSIAVSAKPEMEGFVVREAPRADVKAREIQKEDGVWYESVIWKAAITPIAEGDLAIGPMRLEAGFRGIQTFSVASDGINVRVAALPLEGAPDGFVPGTLGRFRMEARLEDTEVALGESATLTVTITGTGNIAALKEPAIMADETIRIDSFATAQTEEDIDIGQDGLSGTRTFKFLLTPGKMPAGPDGGRFTISVAPFTFFDYQAGQWGLADAGSLVLTVKGSRLAESAGERRAPTLGIIETSSLKDPPVRSSAWFTPTRILILLFVPVLVLAAVEIGFAVKRRRHADGGRIASRKALRKAMAELARLERHPPQDVEFWTSMESVLRGFVEARFGISTAAATPARVASELDRAGAGAGPAQDILELLELCSLARFARQAPAADRQGLTDRIGKCLAALDRSGGGVK